LKILISNTVSSVILRMSLNPFEILQLSVL